MVQLISFKTIFLQTSYIKLILYQFKTGFRIKFGLKTGFRTGFEPNQVLPKDQFGQKPKPDLKKKKVIWFQNPTHISSFNLDLIWF